MAFQIILVSEMPDMRAKIADPDEIHMLLLLIWLFTACLCLMFGIHKALAMKVSGCKQGFK